MKRSLPGFSRGSSPPPSRAHAFTPSPLGDPLFLLSSRSRLRPRCASRLVSSRRALSLRPLASSRKRTARRPGRSEQLSPAFPSSNSACAARDVPLALPHAILLLSRSLRPSVRSADALSVSPLPRSTQPSLPPFLLISIVPILFSSHLAAPHILSLSYSLFLSLCYPAFPLFPSFLLDGRRFYRPSSTFYRVISLDHIRFSTSLSCPSGGHRVFWPDIRYGSNLNASRMRKRGHGYLEGKE